jgi:F0F1-type ATP synthase assembly protein I
MRTSRLAVAAALALVGAVWVGQGVGLIPGSFMTGDPLWALIGSVLLVAAAGIAALERRRG